MQLISFTPDRPVILLDKEFKVVGIKPPNVVELQDSAGDIREYEFEKLFKQYELRNLRFPKPSSKPKKTSQEEPLRLSVRLSSDLSDKARSDGLVKKGYLDAIVRQGLHVHHMTPELKKLLEQKASELKQKKHPSISTLQRWLSQRLYGGDDTALMPYYAKRGGPGKSRLPSSTQRVMDRVIDNLYMSPEKPTVKLCFDACVAEITEKNQWLPTSQQISLPSYNTFLRFTKRRSGYEVVASRLGRRAAELEYRSNMKSTENYSLNECWEMDHTILDIFVMNPATGKPERPRITVAVEFVSRALMGFDIGFGAASAQAALSCLRHAIMPKNYLRERYPEINGDWPCHGVPHILKVDNGMEFHSKSFKHACLDLNIAIQYCATASPWQKGRVERFFRTLNESMVGLPGATGSHLYANKSDLKPGRGAVLDLPMLVKLMHMWVVDDYLPGKHRGQP